MFWCLYLSCLVFFFSQVSLSTAKNRHQEDMASLQEQQTKAEELLQKSSNDSGSLEKEVSTLNTDNRKLQELNKNQEKEIEELKATLQSKGESLVSMSSELEGKVKEIQSLQQMLHQHETEMTELKQLKQESDSEVNNLKSQLEELENQLRSFNSNSNVKDTELEDLRKECKDKEKTIYDLKLSVQDKETDACKLQGNESALKTEVCSLQTENKEKESIIQSLNVQIEELKHSLSARDSELSKSHSMLTTITSDKESLSNELQKANERYDSVSNQLDELQEEKEYILRELEEKKENIKELSKKVEVLIESLSDKNNELERKNSESNHLKSDLNEVKTSYSELSSQKSAVDRQLEELQTMCKEKDEQIQNLSSSSEDSVKSLQELVAEKDSKIQTLLDTVSECEVKLKEMENGLRISKAESDEKVQKLEQELYEVRERLESKLTELEETIRNKDDEIKRVTNKLTDTNSGHSSKVESLQSEIKTLLDNRSALSKELAAKKESFKKMEEQVVSLQNSLEKKEETIQEMLSVNQTLKDENQKKADSLQQKTQDLEVVHQERAELTESLGKLTREIEEKSTENSLLTEKVSDLKHICNEHQSTIEALNHSVADMHKRMDLLLQSKDSEISALNEHAKSMSTECQNHKSQCESLQSQIEHANSCMKELHEKYEQSSDFVKVLEEKNHKFEEELLNKQEENQLNQLRIDELERSLQSSEIIVSEHESEFEQLTSKVSATFRNLTEVRCENKSLKLKIDSNHEIVSGLQNLIEEKDKTILTLETDLKKNEEKMCTLINDLEEKVKWIDTLNAEKSVTITENEELLKIIDMKQSDLENKTALLMALERDNEERMKEINKLNEQVNFGEKQLLDIKKKFDDKCKELEEKDQSLEEKSAIFEERAIKVGALTNEKLNLDVQLNSAKEKIEELKNVSLDLRKKMNENAMESEHCISGLKREIDEKQACVESITKINTEICDELELLKEMNKNDASRIEELTSELKTQTEKRTLLEEANVQTKCEVKRLEGENDSHIEIVDRLKVSSEKLQLENNLLKESIEDKEKEIIDLKNNVEQLATEIYETKEFSAKKETEIQKLNAIICEGKSQILKEREKLEILEKAETAAKDELTKTVSNLNQSLSNAELAFAAANKEIEDIKRTNEENVHHLESKYNEQESLLQKTHARLQELETSVIHFNDNLKNKNEEIEALKETSKCLEEERSIGLQEIQDLRGELVNLTKEMSSKQKELTLIMENMETIKKDNATEIVNLHDELGRTKEEVHTEQEKCRIITNTLEEKENLLQKTIEENEGKIEKLYDELKEKETSISYLNEALNAKGECLRKLEESHSIKDIQIDGMNSEIADLQNNVTRSFNTIEDLKIEIDQVMQRICQTEKDKEKFQKLCENSQAEIQGLENTVKENDVTNSSLQEILQQTEETCCQLSADLECKAKEVIELRKETSKLNLEIEKLQSYSQSLCTQLSENEQIVTSLESKLKHTLNDLEALKKDRASAEQDNFSKIQDLMNKNMKTEELLLQREGELQNLKEDVNTLKFDRDCLVKWIQSDDETTLEESAVSEEMTHVFKQVHMLKLTGKVARDQSIKMKIQIDVLKQELENVEQNLESVKSSHVHTSLVLVKERKEVSKIHSDLKDVINAKDELLKQFNQTLLENEEKDSEIKSLKSVIDQLKLDSANELTVQQQSHDVLVQKTKDTLKEMYKEKDKLIQELKALNDKNQLSCKKIEAAEKQMETLHTENSEMSSKLAQLKDENQSFVTRSNDLQETIQILSEEKSSYQNDIKEKLDSIKQLKDELESINSLVEESENKLQNALTMQNLKQKEFCQEKEDLLHKVDILTNHIAKIQESLTVLENEKSALQEDLKKKKQQLETSDGVIETLNQENHTLRQNVECFKLEIAELNITSEKFEKANTEKSNNLSLMTEKIQGLERELNEERDHKCNLQDELAQVKKLIKDTENALELSKEEINDKEQRIQELQEENVKLTEIESSLKEKVGELFDSYAVEIKRKEAYEERIKSKTETVTESLAEIKILQELNSKLNSTLEEKETVIVHQKEKQLELVKTLARTQQEVTALNETVASLENQIIMECKKGAEISLKNDDLIKFNCKLQEGLEILRTTVDELNEKNQTAQEYIMEIKDSLDLRTNELSCLYKEKKEMIMKMESLQNDYETCLSEKQNFEEVVKEQKDSLNEKLLSLSMKDEENVELTSRVLAMEYEIVQFREKICKHEEETEIFEKEIAELDDCYKSVMHDKTALETKVKEAKDEKEGLVSKYSAVKMEFENINEYCQDLDCQYKNLLKEIEDVKIENDLLSKCGIDKDEKLKNLLSEIDELKSVNQSLGVSLSESEAELERLKLDLQKSFGMNQEKQSLLHESMMESQHQSEEKKKLAESVSIVKSQLDAVNLEKNELEKCLSTADENILALKNKIKDLELAKTKLEEMLQNNKTHNDDQIRTLESLVKSLRTDSKEKEDMQSSVNETLLKEKKKLSRSLQDFEEKLLNTETKLHKIQEEQHQLKNSNNSLLEENETFSEKMFTIENQMCVLQSEIEEMQSKILSEKEMSAKLFKEKQYVRAELLQKENMFSCLQHEFNVHHDFLQQKEDKIRMLQQQKSIEIESLNKEIYNLKDQIQILQGNVLKEIEEKTSFSDRLFRFESECSVIKEYAEELECRQIELTEVIKKLRKDGTVREKTLYSDLTSKINTIDSLNKHITELQISIESKDEKLNQVSCELTLTKELYSTSENECKQINCRSLELASDLEREIQLKSKLLLDNEQLCNLQSRLEEKIVDLEKRILEDGDVNSKLENTVTKQLNECQALEKKLEQYSTGWSEETSKKDLEIQELKTKIDVLQDEYELLNTDNHGKTSLLRKINEDLRFKTNRICEMQSKLDDLDEKNEFLQSTLNKEIKTRKQILIEQEEIICKVKSLEDEVVSYNENLCAVQAEKQKLECELSDHNESRGNIMLKNNELVEECSSLKHKIEKAENHIQNSLEKLNKDEEVIGQLKAQNAAMEGRIEELQKETQYLEDCLKDKDAAVLTLTHQVGSLTEIKTKLETNINDLQNVDHELKNKNDQIINVMKEIEELKSRENVQSHAKAMLISQCETFAEKLEDTTALLKNERQKSNRLKQKLSDGEAKFDFAVNEKSHLSEECKQLNFCLTEKVDQCKQYCKEIDTLNENIKAKEDSLKSLKEDLLKKETDIENLQKDYATVCQQMDATAKELKDTRENLSKQLQCIESLQRKNDLILSENEDLQNAKHSVDVNNKITLTEIKRMKEKMNDKEQEIAQVKESFKLIEKLKLESELKLKNVIMALKTEACLKTDIGGDENEFTFNQLEKELQNMREAVVNASEENSKLKAESKNRELLLKRASESQEEMSKKYNDTENRLEQILREKDLLESELMQTKSEYATLQEQIHVLTENNNSMTKKVNHSFQLKFRLINIKCWFFF